MNNVMFTVSLYGRCLAIDPTCINPVVHQGPFVRPCMLAFVRSST